MAGVQMAGQQQVHAAFGKHLQRQRRAVHQVILVEVLGQVKGMMRDDDARQTGRQTAQAFTQDIDLLVADAAILERQRAGRVDAQHGDFLVHVFGRQIVRHVAPVFHQWRQKAGKDVIQGHVMVARHHHLRPRQAVEKSPRLLELHAAGALRQVARDHHHVRLQAFDQRAQGRQQGRIDPAKMQIG